MAHRIVSKLAVVAVLAASIPAAALAHDGDRDCDHRAGPVVVAPVYAPPAPAAWNDRGDRDWRDGGRDRDGWRWRREAAWREGQRHQVVDQLRALDAERAAVHARVHNPWRLARYDRSYSERRGELERRLADLGRLAWR